MALASSKLATIITAGKVDGASMTNLANIPAGAGSIPSANITSLPDSSLATISTAGKVSGAAIISISSLPSGAGVIPLANIGALFGIIASKTVGTIYQAATDGIVYGFVSGGAANTTMISYSDATATPSTVIQEGTFTFVGGGPNGFVPVCFPVKKNYYFQVTGGTGGTLNFMPIGA